jgi:hypothetical protein
MTEPTTVIAILGRAYTGSTLLGALLENEPGVFHGGELQRLTNHEDARCGSCLGECPVWTQEARAGYSRTRPMYERIASLTRSSILVDGSKRPIHFDERIACGEPVRWAVVTTRKHPMRLLASILTKRFPASAHPLGPTPDVTQAATVSIEKLTRFEHRRHRFFAEHRDRLRAAATLSYEDLATHPGQAAAAVLDMIDWIPSPGVTSNVRGHPLGGNWAFHERSRSGPVSVQMDDRYAMAFDERFQSWLAGSPAYQNLCKMTGYDALPS